MKLIIEYESSWRNSFLDGSNNEPLPKKGRNYIGSMTKLKSSGNFIQRPITKDTVMGVLNRLIGDQAKLYQARLRDDYYFSDIESLLQESDIIDNPVISNEMIYLRNVSGSTDQNSYTGLIKSNDPSFRSDYASHLWSLLWLDLDEIQDFILGRDVELNHKLSLDPVSVCAQLDSINSEKAVSFDEKTEAVLKVFESKFPEIENYLNAKKQIPRISLYASALYIQIEKLKSQFDLSELLTKQGGLSGISKRGFTKKDFMSRYTTGNKKMIWGNPYLKKEKKKGEGEVTSILTKASGTLEINLNISRERALDLEQKIYNAGVSTFYLGKKGLAYLKDMRV